jgi:hypothetical protein
MFNHLIPPEYEVLAKVFSLGAIPTTSLSMVILQELHRLRFSFRPMEVATTTCSQGQSPNLLISSVSRSLGARSIIQQLHVLTRLLRYSRSTVLHPFHAHLPDPRTQRLAYSSNIFRSSPSSSLDAVYRWGLHRGLPEHTLPDRQIRESADDNVRRHERRHRIHDKRLYSFPGV